MITSSKEHNALAKEIILTSEHTQNDAVTYFTSLYETCFCLSTNLRKHKHYLSSYAVL